MLKKIGFQNLKEEVVDSGLCTGCGTCVGVCAARAISMDYEADEPVPILTGKCINCGICYDVCPGKYIPLPELDKDFLGKVRDFEVVHLGVYKCCSRGYAKDEDIRSLSSSGGMISSLLICALEEKIIDAVILSGWRKDKPWRCEPYIATTPEEVMKALRSGMMIKEFRPDLIVLDVMLPDINGKEVCQLVRGDKSMNDVGIICISGIVEEDKVNELKAAGASDFMRKPFDVDVLIDRICQFLDVEVVPAR